MTTEFADEIVTTTTIDFDWRDRLRLAFGARLTVQTRTRTELRIGRADTPDAKVDLWWSWRRRGGAMAAAQDEERS